MGRSVVVIVITVFLDELILYGLDNTEGAAD